MSVNLSNDHDCSMLGLFCVWFFKYKWKLNKEIDWLISVLKLWEASSIKQQRPWRHNDLMSVLFQGENTQLVEHLASVQPDILLGQSAKRSVSSECPVESVHSCFTSVLITLPFHLLRFHHQWLVLLVPVVPPLPGDRDQGKQFLFLCLFILCETFKSCWLELCILIVLWMTYRGINEKGTFLPI